MRRKLGSRDDDKVRSSDGVFTWRICTRPIREEGLVYNGEKSAFELSELRAQSTVQLA